MHAGRQTQARLYAARGGTAVPLPRATQLPAFRGAEDTVFTLAEGLLPGRPLYARIDGAGGDAEPLRFSYSTLDRTLARGAEHARMIALAFGALVAVALAALLIWFVLAERLFILYATLFFLQALVRGLSFRPGIRLACAPACAAARLLCVERSCGFERRGRLLVHARDRGPQAFLTAGIRGVRLVRASDSSSSRSRISRSSSASGRGSTLSAICCSSSSAVFTMIAAFVAWRRGNRAAGWFLIAWALLEGFTMAAAVRFLIVPHGLEPAALLLRLAPVDGGGGGTGRPRAWPTGCVRSASP